jgi:hypothetical protein
MHSASIQSFLGFVVRRRASAAKRFVVTGKDMPSTMMSRWPVVLPQQ